MADKPITSNPFSPTDYQRRKLVSARDGLLFALDSAVLRANETLWDITDEEYNWEPLSESERQHDMILSVDKKRVWRVFEENGAFTYDYGGDRNPPAFTTIAWIMNHIAGTADLYLYCVTTGKQVGEERTWLDVPVYSTMSETRAYIFRMLQNTRDYLLALDEREASDALNKLTPAPIGAMRPTFLNLWGGIIEHTVQHTMQIAVRKERIRERF